MKGFQPGNKLALRQFCPRGHDKDLLGRIDHGTCLTCERRRIRKCQWKRWGIVNANGTPFAEIDYDRAYQVQQGKCLGCYTHQSDLSGRLNVDHDHKTKVFRALLCRTCNRVLGLIKDNPFVLERLKCLLG
jgi:hypothetical protein